MKRPLLPILVLLLATTGARAQLPPHPTKVSADGRFLLTADDKPFFYLGDTAWELFHRLDRAEAERYLDDRAAKGFTVIQAVALAELDGHTDPNPYGHLPLTDLDPARPAVADGPENDYWDHVDFIVDAANRRGLVIGLLPTWGRYWRDKVLDDKPLFTSENAEAYGRFLGGRYKGKAVIWILGGDRPVENDTHRAILRAMARGIDQADEGHHLMTFHPPGASGSTKWVPDEPWLDFHMRQNGHAVEFTGRYDQTGADYARLPAKPVLDGEPVYEDHPINFAPDKLGHSLSADVRRPLYWNLFQGAFGHTYGHHSVWQMWRDGRNPINRPLMPWDQAIDRPGAGQMQHGRRLIESRPMLGRIPDDSIIVPASSPSSVPGAGRYRFVATRDQAGTYAMVYAPAGRSFEVRMDAIAGPEVKAWWFDPRTGQATEIGLFPSEGHRRFDPPAPGEELDWVLVLDDASNSYPPPGQPSDN
jgi:hypothetical protein